MNTIEAVTIKNAINKIGHREYLLPGIQRKFVWKSRQIEVFFDSIMRGFPINTFMFWEIKESYENNNKDFKFYDFLSNYVQLHKTENNPFNITGFGNFYAVIDGQQRLTSLNIGLRGSYAYKLPNKKWENLDNFPERFLYLNLTPDSMRENEEEERDNGMEYCFRFLTRSEYEDSTSSWFKVGDILKFNNTDDIKKYLEETGWTSEYAESTLLKLFNRIHVEKIINYYLIKEEQDIDKVLDVFVRTNSGGTTLTYSNLLMSNMTANWKEKDARDEFEKLIKRVYSVPNTFFIIDSDFILKTCLVLFAKEIKFGVKNIDNVVDATEKNWGNVNKSILQVFELLGKWHFNEKFFKAKNAAIPLIYFFYYNDMKSLSSQKVQEIKADMKKWLCQSLLKRVFSGQTDSVLTNIRRILEVNKDKGYFPIQEIKDAFKDSQAKNLTFTEENILSLLKTKKQDPYCFVILSLLYPNLDQINGVDIDHLHPADYFKKLKKEDWMKDEDFEYYKNSDNWNTIPNLQLLDSSLNRSKQDKSLIKWVEDIKESNILQYIPEEDGILETKKFKSFIEKRSKLMKDKLIELIGGISDKTDISAVVTEPEQEEVEELSEE